MEAAHIVPYKGTDTNVIQNGLLLRADWHTLFDLGYWSISEDYTILLSEALKSPDYTNYSGAKIRLPKGIRHYPSLEALALHRKSLK